MVWKLGVGLAMIVGLAGAQGPADPYWPKEIDNEGVHLVIYQPQVDSWKKDRLEARSVVTVTPQGATNEAFGIVTLSARTEVDKESRMVALEDLKVTDASFPAAGQLRGTATKAVRDSLPNWPRSISLDRLLADLSIANAEAETQSAVLKNDPPRIIFSASPAVLIVIDGEPVYQAVEGTRYKHVENTPALIVYDEAASRFYLDGETLWMTATSLNGPWSLAANPPADLAEVKVQVHKDQEEDPHDHSKDAGAPAPGGPPPAVYVSTTPAELIQTNGAPQYAPIPRTQLTYVTNSDNDIFVYVKSQEYYTLLSGRWYEAKSLNGPWSWVAGNQLPGDFSRIPPDSTKSSVLASIPGTPEAKEAVVANQIPQTASVKRSEAKLNVRYDGQPQFQPIQGTGMEYAINTSTEVIHAQGRYYAVHDGVWFVADSPTGQWIVADTIPPEIYSIPPSSPLYHVRYVYVYGATPDYVYFGYTPGYLGAFISDGVVVYGTGWWYPGWCGGFYYGWPWTWGFGFHFGYWTGGWFWRPLGGYWWYHNPWYMHRVFSEHWNPHWSARDRAWARGNANVYSRWQGGAAVRSTVARPAVANARAGAARGDLYAGRDGKVYEHRQDGWYQRNNNSQNAQKVKPAPNLEQQRQSRQFGAARQGEFQDRGHSMGMPQVSAPRMGGGGGGRRR